MPRVLCAFTHAGICVSSVSGFKRARDLVGTTLIVPVLVGRVGTQDPPVSFVLVHAVAVCIACA